MKNVFTLVKANWKLIILVVWMSFITYAIIHDSLYPPASSRISSALNDTELNISMSIFGSAHEVMMHINEFDTQINSKIDAITSEINSIKSDVNKIKYEVTDKHNYDKR
jgi:sensor histidine kinase regulating citrate/malate metabolism